MSQKMRINQELLDLRRQHVPVAPYNIAPIFIESAKGALLKDVEGMEYIDFGGGIGVENLGHCQPEVVAAVKDQTEKYMHTCFHVAMYEPYVELAKRINEIAPGDFQKKTFFVNSGAEAVENAIKIARYVTKRQGVISFQNAYHGRTYMAMSLTSQAKPYKWGFGPFCSEVYRAPYAYCYRCPFGREYPECGTYCGDYLEDFFVTNVAPDSVAAVILEPVQGEGGFIVPPSEFIKKIEAICKAHGILLIADEIQTGMGRTGKRFACEHFGLTPDILLTGKSIAAGLPLAGITGRAEIMDIPHVGGLGGTFCGNPLACRAGLAVLDLLNEEMLEKAMNLGGTLESQFHEMKEDFEIIGDVRNLGPMIGMELVEDPITKEPAADKTKQLVKNCLEKGLILLSCGIYHNVIRTLIPFVITGKLLERGLDILKQSVSEIDA